MLLSALTMATTIALTPPAAVEQARVMVLLAIGEAGQVRFKDVRLKSLGADMIFCGKANTRFADGNLTGWRDVLIVVSGNPNAQVVLTGDRPLDRYVITESCRHGAELSRRDYSAALNPGF